MGGLKYRASEQEIKWYKAFFDFAEYSSYRTTEFIVQALSLGRERDKVKGPSNYWDYALMLSCGYSSAWIPDLRSDV